MEGEWIGGEGMLNLKVHKQQIFGDCLSGRGCLHQVYCRLVKRPYTVEINLTVNISTVTDATVKRGREGMGEQQDEDVNIIKYYI